MADCDICGRPATTKAIIEGATLSVCARCVQYGRELSAPATRRPQQSRPMVELEVVEGYGRIVRQARERAGLTRQELARKLFILENVLERIENEHLKPNEAVAKKLEKELGITLLGPRGEAPSFKIRKRGKRITHTVCPSAFLRKRYLRW